MVGEALEAVLIEQLRGVLSRSQCGYRNVTDRRELEWGRIKWSTDMTYHKRVGAHSDKNLVQQSIVEGEWVIMLMST